MIGEIGDFFFTITISIMILFWRSYGMWGSYRRRFLRLGYPDQCRLEQPVSV